MDGAELEREPAGLLALVEKGLQLAAVVREIEPTGECMEAGVLPYCDGRDRSRVHAAAEIGAQRDIAHELAGDRLGEALAHLPRTRFEVLRRVGRKAEIPIL